MSPIYEERQRFNIPWLKYLILLPALFVWYIFYEQIILNKPWGKNPAPDAVVVMLVVLIGILTPLLFYKTELILQVRTDGFYYRFFPFHRRFHYLLWTDIARYERITFSAVKDFGGYGIRYAKGEKIFVFQGKEGIRFYLRNGKRVVFSAARVDSLSGAISSVSGL